MLKSSSQPALFIVGGRNYNTSVPDTWLFEIDIKQWTAVVTTVLEGQSNPGIYCNGSIQSFSPAQHVFATGATLQGLKKFVMLGGATLARPIHPNSALSRTELDCFDNAMWVLDADTAKWTYMELTRQLYPRIEAAVAVTGDANLLVFGGGINGFYANDMASITLGCNRGSASPNFSRVACEFCPLGTYASSPGMASCSGSCVNKVTTSSVGSWSLDNCTVVSGRGRGVEERPYPLMNLLSTFPLFYISVMEATTSAIIMELVMSIMTILMDAAAALVGL